MKADFTPIMGQYIIDIYNDINDGIHHKECKMKVAMLNMMSKKEYCFMVKNENNKS